MSANRSFWVIVAGNTPTAFRSRFRDALLPTLRQLQRTQPDADLRWFERGRMWASAEEARAARSAERQARDGRSRERGPDWRPGGSHEDPRARFKLTRDQKRARFRKRLQDKAADQKREGRPPSGERRPKPPREAREHAPGARRPSKHGRPGGASRQRKAGQKHDQRRGPASSRPGGSTRHSGRGRKPGSSSRKK